MGHLQKVEEEFRKLLGNSDEDALVRFVTGKILESYHNGLAGRGKAEEKGGKPNLRFNKGRD